MLHRTLKCTLFSWYERKNRLLLAVPNADLLSQWVEIIEQYYTIPYVVLKSSHDLVSNAYVDDQNPFVQDSLVIATYDFLVEQEAAAASVLWDLTVFEEATALSSVYV